MVTRRDLLAAAAPLLAVSCGRSGREATSQEAVRRYLGRIAQVDTLIHAVVEINPDAMQIARELDEERRAGRRRGPLHGVPILIKDNIDTADRMMTTAGSLALVGAPRPRQDAGIVTKLRQAGVVILGKTNLSEWANIRSPRSTSGWSARGGQTNNPHALDRNPSGSSSGSAAAVAAELCAMAVGTETDGSIVSPSSNCGIVGIKPTVGLLSGQGIIPISHSQDTAGPMARTVAEAAVLLSAMNERGLDFTGALRDGALQGARLGVARGYFGSNPGVRGVIESAMSALAKAGAVLVDPVELPADRDPALGAARRAHDQLLAHDARRGDLRWPADALQGHLGDGGRAEPHLVLGQAKQMPLGPGGDT